jgi:hypothetical protein
MNDLLIRRFHGPRPPIICLCGSTRFITTWNHYRQWLTYCGYIVLAIEIVTTQTASHDPQHTNHPLKHQLDELHKRKIDLADQVLVLNVGGYTGPSTRAEISYARRTGTPVTFLEHHHPATTATRPRQGGDRR